MAQVAGRAGRRRCHLQCGDGGAVIAHHQLRFVLCLDELNMTFTSRTEMYERSLSHVGISTCQMDLCSKCHALFGSGNVTVVQLQAIC